MYLSMMQSFP